MRQIFRIARLDASLLRRNVSVMATHLVALSTILMMSATRIREEPHEAAALITLLLLGAAAGAPLSVGVHTLIGERFRGTLEPLLLLPIRRSTLLAGKSALVLLIAVVEIGVVALFFLVLGHVTSNAAVLAALTSRQTQLVMLIGAPQLALMLTLVVITISGRARDAQAASNLAILTGAPVAAVVLGLWFGALAMGPRLAVIGIAAGTFLCAVAARTAVACLTDDRLLARRG